MTVFEKLLAKNGCDKIIKINELKDKLASTDYLAIKYAEGWISAEDYEAIKAERESYREQIRELES